MSGTARLALAAGMLAGISLSAAAQQQQPPAVPPPLPPEVAAAVNGQPVLEKAVQRGLRQVPPNRRVEARPQVLAFLIDHVLIDQYIQQLGVKVEPKDVDGRLTEVKAEIQKSAQGRPDLTYDKVLKDLMFTEEELRAQIGSDLRWEQFAGKQATDEALRKLFDGNREMFDGTMVRARHILLTPPVGDAEAARKAPGQLVELKKQIEKKVTEELAKLPPFKEALEREQARTRLLDDTFAALAREKSDCPSKQQGGDLSFFPRAGSMVEPFAAAAFALKPYQMSDVVQTQFGFHLLLATERRPGKDIKFEDVKAEVREVFCERLREALCAQLRPAAKVAINPAPKP